MNQNELTIDKIEIEKHGPYWQLSNLKQANEWESFHDLHCDYQILCVPCHKKKTVDYNLKKN